jgi:hypothetical protein
MKYYLCILMHFLFAFWQLSQYIAKSIFHDTKVPVGD